jgi:hypothetical protein
MHTCCEHVLEMVLNVSLLHHNWFYLHITHHWHVPQTRQIPPCSMKIGALRCKHNQSLSNWGICTIKKWSTTWCTKIWIWEEACLVREMSGLGKLKICWCRCIHHIGSLVLMLIIICTGAARIPLNNFSREIVARKPCATNSWLFRVYFASISRLCRD